jgi:hypothetical protein
MPVKQHNQPLSGIIVQIGLLGAVLWPKLEGLGWFATILADLARDLALIKQLQILLVRALVHELQIQSSRFFPPDHELLPTRAINHVEGTPGNL